MDQLLAWSQDRKRWRILVFGVLVLGIVWIALSAVPSGTSASTLAPSPRAGFQAPAFSLAGFDGETLSLSDLQGKVVVVNLWASWCPPCRAEMPALETASKTFPESELVILGIHMTSQDSEQNAAEFVDQYGLSFPILLDREGQVGRLYQSRALPTTYFIDRRGVIREVVVGGPISEITLRSTIESLLQERGS